MKFLITVTMVILFGCQSQPTSEELEYEALRTGDWSAVDENARMTERMSVSSELKCPEHLMRICIKDGEHEECYCQPRR